MIRKRGIEKLYRICERLDALNPETFFVIPLRLYLFGSLLTNKPDPTDVDVLFQYQDRSDLNSTEILHAMSYGKPLPHARAMMHLRKGMQMIHIELLYAGRSVELWLQEHAFDPDTPVKLIWERGFDWQNALREVETKPVDWNPEIEQRNKHMQETARRIREEQGDLAAEEWPETMKPGGA